MQREARLPGEARRSIEQCMWQAELEDALEGRFCKNLLLD
jgi:hypothetical protein